MALVCTIVIVLSITGLSMLKIIRAVRIRSSKLIAEMSAQNAADTGIDLGIEYVYDLWTASAPDLIDIDYTSPLKTLMGTRNVSKYYYTVDLCDDYPGYEITSYATSGSVTKVVHFRMLIQHPWVGIAAKDSININVGTGIELQPADYPDFNLVTNQIYPSAIVLRNGVYIPGDVIVGPGGDPDSVIDTKHDAYITGETWSMLEDVVYPDVSLPSLGYATLGTDPNDPGAMIMDTSGIYGSITIDTGETLKVVGDIVAVLEGPFIAKNSGSFLVTAGSTLRMYLLDNLEMKYGSVFYNENFGASPTYEDIRDATKSVKIYGASTCTSIIFKNSSVMAAAVYAPYADVSMYNDADFYGAIMGEDVEIKNAGNFIFVFGLYDDDDRFISNLKTQRGSWWEE